MVAGSNQNCQRQKYQGVVPGRHGPLSLPCTSLAQADDFVGSTLVSAVPDGHHDDRVMEGITPVSRTVLSLTSAVLPLLSGMTLMGCMTTTEASGGPGAPVIAAGQLATAGNAIVGSATISAVDTATIRLTIAVSDMAPGTFGTHVHAVGRCDGPDFMSAGPHWNPAGRQHGRENPMGSHAGDLPNIVIGADRRGQLAIDMPAAQIDSLFDADGAAVIIHAAADDEMSDPTGNSGARVACAVLGRVTSIPPPG